MAQDLVQMVNARGRVRLRQNFFDYLMGFISTDASLRYDKLTLHSGAIRKGDILVGISVSTYYRDGEIYHYGIWIRKLNEREHTMAFVPINYRLKRDPVLDSEVSEKKPEEIVDAILSHLP